MSLIQTQAGASAAEVKRLSQAVIEMSPQVGLGPEALAQGLYHIESAGIRGAKALDLLKVAADGAAVGHADLQTVTQALIASTVSGIKGVHSMSDAMGILNGIVGSGDVRMEALAKSFGSGILSTASVFGLSLQDVGAAMATLTDNAMPAQQAATRLRMTISMMGAPSAAAQKVMKSLGMSALEMGNDMRSGGIVKALEDLKAHLAGLSKGQQALDLSRMFGGGQTSSALLLLLTQLDRVKSKFGEISGGAQQFGAAVTATHETAAYQMKQLAASFDSIQTAIGTAALPVMSQFLGMLTPVITGIANWAAKNPQLAATIIAVAGGVGALTAAIAILSAALAANPIVLAIMAVVAAVALLAIAWQKDWGGIREKFAAVIAALRPVFSSLVAALGDVARWAEDLFKRISTNHDVITALQVGLNAVWTVLSALGSVLATVVAAIGQFFTWLVKDTPAVSILQAAVGELVHGFQTLWQAGENVVATIQKMLDLAGQASKAVGSIPGMGLAGGVASNVGGAIGNVLNMLPHFASGGMVNGPTLAIVGEAGPEAIIPMSGLSTRASSTAIGVASATSGVSAAQRAVELAALRLKDAQIRLAEVEDRHYKSAVTRANAIMAAQASLLASQDNLKNAQDRLTLMHDKLGLAEQKALGSGTTMNVGGSVTIPVGSVPIGTAPGGVGTVATTAPTYEIQVYLDSTPITNAVTKVLFKQIQRKAGPAVAGSPF